MRNLLRKNNLLASLKNIETPKQEKRSMKQILIKQRQNENQLHVGKK